MILVDEMCLVSIFIKIPNYVSSFTEGVAYVFSLQLLLQ